MTRFPGLVLFFACLFATHSAFAKAATDWHVIKVSSRDYLSVDNIVATNWKRASTAAKS
jgi:hypothetical protein